MKPSLEENKQFVIDIIRENCSEFVWVRDNFEFTTTIEDYKIHLDQNNDGTTLQVVYVDSEGEYYSYIINADDNNTVKELYKTVFDEWNRQREENFWAEAVITISNNVLNRRNSFV